MLPMLEHGHFAIGRNLGKPIGLVAQIDFCHLKRHAFFKQSETARSARTLDFSSAQIFVKYSFTAS